MEYFIIEKSNIKYKFKKKLSFKGGYVFNHKVNITLYNHKLTENILNKKINSSLKKIISLLTQLNEEDDDGVNELRARIETLRNLLLGSYFPYLSKAKIKTNLLKLQELENKIPKREIKKSRSR